MENSAQNNEKLQMEPEELANLCFDICEEKKAADILLFDVRDKSIIADYYLVCSGTSLPHILAIGDNIRKSLNAKGVLARGQDGEPGSKWMILDYGTVLVHILEPQMRNFYALEQLWAEERIVRRGGQPLPMTFQQTPVQGGNNL